MSKKIEFINYGAMIVMVVTAISCTNNEESIVLTCEGVETTSGVTYKGEQMHPESRDVNRTFEVFKTNKKIQSGIKVVDLKNNQTTGDYREQEKKVWVMKIDSKIEIFEESSNLTFDGKNIIVSSSVDVKDDAIHATQEVRQNYPDGPSENLSHQTNLDISINRISGNFHQTFLERGVDKSKQDSFKTEIIGSCKRLSEKKI